MSDQTETMDIDQQEQKTIASELGGKGTTGVFLAMVLTGLFMIVEFAGGVYSHSVALLADAFYMLVDCASLGLAWHLMSRVNKRSSASGASPELADEYVKLTSRFGFAAGVMLIVSGLFISCLAISRLIQDDIEIRPKLMFWIGIAGLGVNTCSLMILSASHLADVNAREATRHIVSDLVGSLAVVAASLAIVFGSVWFIHIDAILAIAFAALMLCNGWVSISRARREKLIPTQD